ncbi:hypothetical protein BJF78_06205 [Pseudonocardia sp. CNS-139]|nr:hypothetical protein BJF78_06205 [Pseudonocardia sp. CNS-139]
MSEPVNLGAVLLGVVVLAGVLGMSVRTWWVRRSHGPVELARVGSTAVSGGRVLGTAAVIVAVQWSVLTYAPTNTALVLAVLGIPALFTAYTVTKAFSVTEVRSVSTRRGGGRR